MPTNYTVYAQYSNATITVTNTSELNAALANLDANGGGTILLDGNGGPYDIQANGIGDANNPILIKAEDPTNEPLVQNIYLQNSSHIAMTQLDVNSIGTGATVQDLRISGSDHIEFVDNSMTSDANGTLGTSGNVIKGGNAALVRNSQDIVFSNNTVTDYNFGVAFQETVGLTFNNNELSGIQGDGFRAGGIQNAVIDNNYMHDFYGSLQTITHNDFIQFWSVNTTLVTTNVEISNNVLDANGGGSAQGVFIGNEGTRNGANGPHYQDIRIHDNVVHSASYNGVSIEGTDNAQIFNNTVLFDDQAHLQTSAGSANTPHEPFIRVTNSTGAIVYGNIAGKVNVNGVLDSGTNNQLLDYTDPATANFVDSYMANLPTWDPNGGTGTTAGSGGSTGGSSTGSGGTGTGTGTGTTGGTDTSGGGTDTGTGTGGGTDTSGGTGTGTGGGTDTSGGTGSGSTGGTDTTGTGGTDTTGTSEEPQAPEEDIPNGKGVGLVMNKSVSALLNKFSNAHAHANARLDQQVSSPETSVTLEDLMSTLTLPSEDDVPPDTEDDTTDEVTLELL